MPLSKITTAALSSNSSTSNLNIDDGTLFVDVSNNNVGIGTTTPRGVFNNDINFVVHGGAGAPRIRLTNNSTGQSGTDGGELNLDGTEFIIENRESGNMRFYVNGSERQRIDSSGRITKPFQPAFHAGNNNGSYSALTTSAFPFNTTRINVGSHYNISTYRFTAPVAGIYAFYYNIFYEGGLGASHDSAFFVNDTALTSGSGSITQMSSRPSTDRITVHHSTIISLSVSDYVDVRARSDSSGNAVFGPHSSFGGYLLG
jgi:hypothetical protein